MRKRLMVGLLAGGLMVAMLPGVASAGPPNDKVDGSVRAGEFGESFNVSAHSGPGGEDATGNLTISYSDGTGGKVAVDCMIVIGDEAIVGGPFKKDVEIAGLSRGYVYVKDNGQPSGTVPDEGNAFLGGSATTCSGVFDFGRKHAMPVIQGNVVVRDAD